MAHKRHRHRYTSSNSDSESRSSLYSYRGKHHHHNRRHHISFGITDLIDRFDAPNFKNWVLIPGLILSVILIIIAIYITYKTYKSYKSDDDITYKFYDDKCKDDLDKTNCSYTEIKVSERTAYFIAIIVSIIIAFTVCLFIYKLVIFVHNPRVAAGYFLFKGLRR